MPITIPPLVSPEASNAALGDWLPQLRPGHGWDDLMAATNRGSHSSPSLGPVVKPGWTHGDDAQELKNELIATRQLHMELYRTYTGP